MKTLPRALYGVVCLCLSGLFISCEKNPFLQNDTSLIQEIAGTESGQYLDRVAAITYNPNIDNYVAIGEKDGQLDAYLGQNGDWQKLPDSLDLENYYKPDEFVALAISGQDDHFGIAVGNQSDQATFITCQNYWGNPVFANVVPSQIGDLNRVLAMDYSSLHQAFYVVGVSNGLLDIWYRQQNEWKQLPESRDLDTYYAPSEFVDFALGENSDEFGIAVGNRNGIVTSIRAQEFSGQLFFDAENPQRIGNLTSVLTIEYNQYSKMYYVVGTGPDGSLDVYKGGHQNWTKTNESTNFNNAYLPAEFVDFTFGGQRSLFGIVVGNISGNLDEQRGTAVDY